MVVNAEPADDLAPSGVHFTKGLWAHDTNFAKNYISNKNVWLDQVTISHMPWQLSCSDMWEIVTWLEDENKNYKKNNFLCDFDYDNFSRVLRDYPDFSIKKVAKPFVKKLVAVMPQDSRFQHGRRPQHRRGHRRY